MGGACAARALRPPVVWAAGRAVRVGPVRKVDKLASVVGMVFIFPECAYGKFLLFKGPGCRTESPAGQERLKEQVVDVMMQVAITVISSAFGKMWEAKLELTENSIEEVGVVHQSSMISRVSDPFKSLEVEYQPLSRVGGAPQA